VSVVQTGSDQWLFNMKTVWHQDTPNLLLYFQLWGWAGCALERDPGSEEEAHPRILDWGEWVLQWGWVWERDGGRAQHHHQDYGVQMGATCSTSRWEFSSSINSFFVSFWLAAAAMHTVVLLWIERTLQLHLLAGGLGASKANFLHFYTIYDPLGVTCTVHKNIICF
jgi:hypothetical protein